MGIFFPFSLYAFWNLNVDITEPAFKALIQKLINDAETLRNKGGMDYEPQPMSKDEVSELSKLLPFRVEILESICNSKSEEKEDISQSKISLITEWTENENIDNLKKEQVIILVILNEVLSLEIFSNG